MAIVKFTPSEVLPTYYGYIEGHDMIRMTVEADYEVPEEKAGQLLADYPDNFTLVSGSKSVEAPSSTKMAGKPERNK